MARLRFGFILLSALFLNIMASNPATGDQGDGNGLLLYSYPYSFYAQKVLLPLYEKNLQFKIQNVDITGGENYKPWYLDINPHGEVPVLKDGVKIIPDSARIIDYLEDNFSGEGHPRLVPQDAAEKQKMNQFREKIDAINGNTVTTGTFYHPEVARDQKIPFIGPVRSSMKADYEKNGDKLRKVAEENPKARDVILAKVEAYEKTKALIKNKESYLGLLDKVDSLLTDVETELASHTDKNMWLVSKDFTVADVGLTILLQRIDLVGLSHRFWLGGKKPEVDKYFQRVQHRESFKKTMPSTWYFWKTLACKVLPFLC